jgi:formate dehydrogenase accessory protein FdhD
MNKPLKEMVELTEEPITFSSEPVGKYSVTRHSVNGIETNIDVLAEEVPVALVYNGISHAVMLATPQDLEDFALGFSLTEGILDNTADLYGIEVIEQENGLALQLEIATACFQRLKEKRRNLTGRTGCGLCGSESLDQALRLPLNKVKQLTKITQQAIQAALTNIRGQQRLQGLTGATHASAWMNTEGEVLLLREDVGRHNALDKLIGAMAKKDRQSQLGFILTTSRASYEMVQKTVSAGCNILVAISAPTGLAIRMAQQSNLTLVGFAREQGFVVYSHAEAII